MTTARLPGMLDPSSGSELRRPIPTWPARTGGTTILNRVQRRLLLRYRAHRHQPFTVSGHLIRLVLLAAVSAGIFGLSWSLHPPKFALFIGGLLVGVLLRNVVLLFHGARVIPILFQVIDWEKVDRLLEPPARDA